MPLSPLRIDRVEINDRFWKPRMEQVRRVMLPYQWEALNDRITGVALRQDESGWHDRLYRADKTATRKARIKAVPYFLWANREPGEMRVWIRATACARP